MSNDRKNTSTQPQLLITAYKNIQNLLDFAKKEGFPAPVFLVNFEEIGSKKSQKMEAGDALENVLASVDLASVGLYVTERLKKDVEKMLSENDKALKDQKLTTFAPNRDKSAAIRLLHDKIEKTQTSIKDVIDKSSSFSQVITKKILPLFIKIEIALSDSLKQIKERFGNTGKSTPSRRK